MWKTTQEEYYKYSLHALHAYVPRFTFTKVTKNHKMVDA